MALRNKIGVNAEKVSMSNLLKELVRNGLDDVKIESFNENVKKH